MSNNEIVAYKIETEDGEIKRFCIPDCTKDFENYVTHHVNQDRNNIESITVIREDNHDEQFGKICNGCHSGLGGWWYVCALCNTFQNSEMGHTCEALPGILDKDPDFLEYTPNDELQICSWYENPIPD